MITAASEFKKALELYNQEIQKAEDIELITIPADRLKVYIASIKREIHDLRIEFESMRHEQNKRVRYIGDQYSPRMDRFLDRVNNGEQALCGDTE